MANGHDKSCQKFILWILLRGCVTCGLEKHLILRWANGQTAKQSRFTWAVLGGLEKVRQRPAAAWRRQSGAEQLRWGAHGLSAPLARHVFACTFLGHEIQLTRFCLAARHESGDRQQLPQLHPACILPPPRPHSIRTGSEVSLPPSCALLSVCRHHPPG